jgi:hypothetical protein
LIFHKRNGVAAHILSRGHLVKVTQSPPLTISLHGMDDTYPILDSTKSHMDPDPEELGIYQRKGSQAECPQNKNK